MAKKKKDAPAKSKPTPAPEPKQEPMAVQEEEVTCPVCGKPVGIDVLECPHCGAEFEPEESEEVVAAPAPVVQAPAPRASARPAPTPPPVAEEPEQAAEEEEVTCPACGKPVGLDVAECPYCGAEFEQEEIEEIVEQPAKPAVEPGPVKEAVYQAESVDEDEMAECPVCGKMVSLAVSSCPSCGAEFEEEEVEEIIEVEEKSTARAAPSEVETEEVEVQEEEVAVSEVEGPTSIMDFRVIGMALIALGILGSQISFMIDWYWTWVPPIGDNLGMFIAIPAIVIVVGLLVFLLIKRASGQGRKFPLQKPGIWLSMFLFGILALVMVMLWNPINDALASSSIGVGVMFVVLLVVGVALIFMGMRSSSRATA